MIISNNSSWHFRIAVQLRFFINTNRLLESTYTVDEIEDVWSDLQSMVSGDVESELIAYSHTNVLLLKQIFEQAQKWHLNLDADLAELENR